MAGRPVRVDSWADWQNFKTMRSVNAKRKYHRVTDEWVYLSAVEDTGPPLEGLHTGEEVRGFMAYQAPAEHGTALSELSEHWSGESMRHVEHFYKMEWGEIVGLREEGVVACHKDYGMWLLLTGLHQQQ